MSDRDEPSPTLTWHVPPEHQGQMIEVAYASDGKWLYRRTHDRSARTVTCERITWDLLADIAPDLVYEPWNGAPVCPDVWEEIAAD